MASTKAWSPAARARATYGATLMPTSCAIASAEAFSRAFGTCPLSRPTRTTGRSVTSARPPAPVMSPRLAAMGVRSRVVPPFRLGSTSERSQVTCQVSFDRTSAASVW